MNAPTGFTCIKEPPLNFKSGQSDPYVLSHATRIGIVGPYFFSRKVVAHTDSNLMRLIYRLVDICMVEHVNILLKISLRPICTFPLFPPLYFWMSIHGSIVWKIIFYFQLFLKFLTQGMTLEEENRRLKQQVRQKSIP